MKTTKILILMLLLVPFTGNSQADSLDRTRLNTLVIGGASAYTAGLIALSELWYSESESQKFQFFDDSKEWKQIDKIGHAYSTFQISHSLSRSLQWTGMNERKSDIIGSISGFLLLVPIEIMDGFSADYGASSTDLIANFAGSAAYLGQKLAWNEVRIHPKFSFRTTPYADIRPALLGENTLQQIIKDYNGQTYWLSVDVYSFLKEESKFPKWLNLAAGYGAEGMIFADDQSNANNNYLSYRQYYLGLDFDLTHIKSRSKAVNTLIFFANMIKIPAPTVEFASNGTTTFHWLYF
jgi:hypothetical protein